VKPQDNNHVRHEFDSYCKKVLKGTAREHFREQKKRASREVCLSELSASELSSLSTVDSYPIDTTIFNVQGEQVGIRDGDLADALAKLSGERRDIVLLSFFMGLTDEEIAKRMDIVRRTVTYRRTASLRELKKIMEGESNE
jgi:RNA polymerase sigma factor (sigma-70 family)